MKNKSENNQYSKSDLNELTALSIYLLMENKGADMFGLYTAPKSVLLKSYEKQIGFKVQWTPLSKN